MADYTTLTLTRDEGVARITLNRPEALNALDEAMARELLAAATACDDDRAVRAVVIAGAGRAFSVGGDLKSFAAQGEALPTHLKDVTTYAHAAVSRLARMRAPVLASVHGAAAGFGMSLVGACDLAIAADNAKFTLAYTRIGLTPDGSSSYSLPRTIGMKRALELALTNPTLDAAQARDWGLVNWVVPADELEAEATRIARELAAGPTSAFAGAKALMRSGGSESLESQMERETRAISEIARGADAREGIDAFLAKRAASFGGE
ncbi:MAG: enoyl-CoA hydratase-related protein [Chloroflexi bacterium]|nr:enoyl-CoA hydratase-related protein [Chloroflexota bacterium]MDA1001767.1 enoyl-CoA hydratase-related protein [Chloroflexota bacterium]